MVSLPAQLRLLCAALFVPSLMLLPQPALASDSGAAAVDAATGRFLQAARTFEEARAGSTAAVPEAQAEFKRLLDGDPSNPLFTAYYGSTFAMQARDGGAPWQKIKWVHEGIGQIDRALTLLGPQHDTQRNRDVPVSLETRLVAIATYVSLPSLFNRMSVARQQLELVMRSPLFATASTELRGRFYYEDALIAHADGDKERERRSLSEVIKYAPTTLDMKEVREQYAKLAN